MLSQQFHSPTSILYIMGIITVVWNSFLKKLIFFPFLSLGVQKLTQSCTLWSQCSLNSWQNFELFTFLKFKNPQVDCCREASIHQSLRLEVMQTSRYFFNEFIREVEGLHGALDILLANAVKGFGEVNEEHNPWRVVVITIV